MDIEQLSKAQILLLTLLVSFVTSIATGIVAVSLMGQAPPSIAQNVNRIIERTVERVVPSGQSAAAEVTREKTVIVTESDLVSQAVAKANPSVVRLYSTDTSNPLFEGLGVVIDSSGLIASDVEVLGDNGDAMITLSDGTHVRAFVVAREREMGVAFLQATTTTKDGKAPAWNPIGISVGQPVLGETIITIAGKSFARIADGIVTALVPQSDSNGSSVVETSIENGSIMHGGILINTSGEVIGISTGPSRAISSSAFAPASALIRQSVPPPTTVKKDTSPSPKQ